jgi:hypothetical protein
MVVSEWHHSGGGRADGLLFFGPLLMILFRQKYPRWWFDWNLELARFTSRVGVYLALMTDRYPSADEQQSVHLDYRYPDAARDLNRWLPLVKWLLAIPHYVVPFFLNIAAFFVVIWAWFVIVFTLSYPRGLFDFVEGIIRWNVRVTGYALTLVTDQYPPFRLPRSRTWPAALSRRQDRYEVPGPAGQVLVGGAQDRGGWCAACRLSVP